MQRSSLEVQAAVQSDDTIDGVDRGVVDVPVDGPSAQGPARDYPELVEVERGHYAIAGEIAKGGMGRVLDARDRRLGREVAIKELLPKNRDAARRFEREARITARLQHPSIIHVYEAGVWQGGEPFYAMTKVVGRSFDKVIAERPTLAGRLALLPHVLAVADALAYAHSQDVIHRDLKPSNVLVGEFGETVVIDWGLAKDLATPADPAQSMRSSPLHDTLDGSVVGTPAYMPPEQARGETVDQHADVYAIGAILYHVLVGVAPYVATSSKEQLDQVLAGPPRPVESREAGVPIDLITIVAKAMARDPSHRYANAGELASDLKRFETGQLVAAHHYTRRQLAWRWLRRNRLAIAVATLAMTSLAIVGAISVRSIIAERDRAEQEQRKDERRRAALLEERGRAELLAGHAGPALVNLVGAVRDQQPVGALGFLIADAMRPFEAATLRLDAGERNLVAYAPDGKLIATASADGRLVLWRPDGSRTSTLQVGGALHAIAWDRAGRQFAAGGEDGVARVWSREGELVRELRGHLGPIGDIAFGADGTHLVTASADATACVWTIASGERVVLAGHQAAVLSARFDGEDLRVVTASLDGTANVWSARTGILLTPLRGHAGPVRIALWDPAGQRIATASVDGTARIWDPDKGKLLVAPLRHERNARVETLAWSHDGERLLTGGSDRTARIWELPGPPASDAMPEPARAIALLPHTDSVVAVAFSADDSWIATAGRVARVWDARGQPIAAFEHGDPIRSVAFSADASHLATGTAGGTARIWEVTHEISPVRAELESPVHAIAVAGQRVVVGTDDSRVTVVDGSAHQVLSAHHGRVLALAASPDGTRFASAGEDREAYVWRAGETTPAHVLVRPTDAVTVAATWSPDGMQIAFGDNAGVVRIWSADGAMLRSLAPASDAVRALAFNPRGDLLVGCLEDGHVVVWSRGGDTLATLAVYGARTLAFDATGAQLVVVGHDEVTVWRFGPGPVPRLASTLDGSVGDVHAVAIDPAGTRIITAGSDGTAKVWDAVKGKLLATRDPHGSSIDALAVTPDGWTLWTGSEDGTARAWDIRVETDRAKLATFIEQHVPWRLGEDDVVRRVGDQEESDDGKRRPDQE